MSNSSFNLFIDRISSIIPKERLLSDLISRYVFANDASHYLLIPKVVIKVSTENEVVSILKIATEYSIPVTFRAAGTSLSGQSQSDSVLLVTDEHWRNYTISEDAEWIRLQPGITGSEANLFLAPFARKIGPDPASIASAKIGGIAANNASGMCCGVKNNSYNTLKGLRIIFADGTLLDTEDLASVQPFKTQKQDWLDVILEIKKTILADAQLSLQIQKRYSIKNTVGYSLNAFLDFEDPIDILAHLMIGSEGTLGFMSSITYNTLPCDPFESVALAFYDSIESACDAAILLQKQEINALELMDGMALSTAIHNPNIQLPKNFGLQTTALLIDMKAKTLEGLMKNIGLLEPFLQETNPCLLTPFCTDRQTYHAIWDLRKGILPAIAGLRTPGSLMLNEDVAVHPTQLKSFCVDLKTLFEKHGYKNASLFGHVKDGNLHFLLEEQFNDAKGVNRYAHFMKDLAVLVNDQYQGSLKAEHGVGRNIAPFVKDAIGGKAYQILWDIKKLLDPQSILNPEVILTQDDTLHLKNLKQIHPKDPLIDRCIECGFCERVCPSKNLTLTPRQRIVAWRNQALLETQADFKYRVDDTCAATGLCSLACPVKINTGELVRKIRAQQRSQFSKFLAKIVSKHYGLAMIFSRIAIKLTQPKTLFRMSPLKISQTQLSKKVIYFESCSTKLFQSNETQKYLKAIFRALDTQIIFITNKSLCCGLSFENKGFLKIAKQKSALLETELLKRSNHGKIPVLSDTSSCTAHFNQNNSFQLLDLIDFLFQHLNDLPIKKFEKTVMLHIPCGIKKLGLGEKMQKIAQACATHVIIPQGIECCGFAGDKGFRLPALNKSALTTLRGQVPEGCIEGYSAHPTCEMGLSQSAGIPYHSILHLLYESISSAHGC